MFNRRERKRESERSLFPLTDSRLRGDGGRQSSTTLDHRASRLPSRGPLVGRTDLVGGTLAYQLVNSLVGHLLASGQASVLAGLRHLGLLSILNVVHGAADSRVRDRFGQYLVGTVGGLGVGLDLSGLVLAHKLLDGLVGQLLGASGRTDRQAILVGDSADRGGRDSCSVGGGLVGEALFLEVLDLFDSGLRMGRVIAGRLFSVCGKCLCCL